MTDELESSLKELEREEEDWKRKLEFVRKRPYDYQCLKTAYGVRALVPIDLGTTSLLVAYLYSSYTTEEIRSTISLGITNFNQSQEASHQYLVMGIVYLSAHLSVSGARLICSFIKQKNIEMNGNLQ